MSVRVVASERRFVRSVLLVGRAVGPKTRLIILQFATEPFVCANGVLGDDERLDSVRMRNAMRKPPGPQVACCYERVAVKARATP